MQCPPVTLSYADDDPIMTSDPAAFDPPPEARQFYADSLAELVVSGIPFMLSGTYALGCHTGIARPTKDLDVFCKGGDAPRILAHFRHLGHEVEFEDERWIGKVWKDGNFFDVIYNISSASLPVTEEWFRDEFYAEVYGTRVRITPPTEFILSKLFIQDRYRYDGADVAHMILKQHETIDWQRMLDAMELHWELLLIHLLHFRFVYGRHRRFCCRRLASVGQRNGGTGAVQIIDAYRDRFPAQRCLGGGNCGPED